MQQGPYNFRNTRARQNRSSDLQSEQSSSSVQVNIESSHTDTEDIDTGEQVVGNMFDKMYAGPDQGKERFLQLLDTLA